MYPTYELLPENGLTLGFSIGNGAMEGQDSQ